MVDGADKINGCSNTPYINQLNSISEARRPSFEPISFTREQEENPYVYRIEKSTIGFEIPTDAPKEAVDFINSLMDNKETLMKVLDIDSETYNILAQTAVAIAGKETDFGTSFADKFRKFIRAPYKWYDQHAGMEQKVHYSMGMTNLKYTIHIKDKDFPEIRDHMLAMGIDNENQLENPAKSAVATIILLSTFNKRIDNDYIEGFTKAQEKFRATKIDALCAMWNGGRSKALVNGNFDPQEWDYTKKVHEIIEDYKLIKE